MTKRDFLTLAIKLFGLFALINSLFSALPSNISYAGMIDFDLVSLAWISGTVLIIFGLFFLLVFKAHWIVKGLQLDKGFEEDYIHLANAGSVIKVGTFIIGGWFLLSNIPPFLSHAFFAFKGKAIGADYGSMDTFRWVVSGLNILIGYLLLTNFSAIGKFFNRLAH